MQPLTLTSVCLFGASLLQHAAVNIEYSHMDLSLFYRGPVDSVLIGFLALSAHSKLW